MDDPFHMLGTPKDLRECVVRICSLPCNQIYAGAAEQILIEYLNNRFGAEMSDDEEINQKLLRLLEHIKHGYKNREGDQK